MTRMPMPEELEALKKALNDALGELRVVRTERDLLKEQLNRRTREVRELNHMLKAWEAMRLGKDAQVLSPPI